MNITVTAAANPRQLKATVRYSHIRFSLSDRKWASAFDDRNLVVPAGPPALDRKKPERGAVPATHAPPDTLVGVEAELSRSAAAHPRDERVAGQLMLA